MADLDQTDWALVRSFLAVAELGSLSAAARQLGVSQPTLGRQIRQIETDLGAGLFTRQPRGFDLTEAGQSILPAAKRMQEAMNDIALTVAGHDTTTTGTVRITASEVVALHYMPGIMANIRAALPGVCIDLVASDRSDNLLFREADIAVRMYRPEQLEIVTRKLGEIRLGVCAARSYLDRCGRPQTAQEMMDHALVGYDQSELILRGMRAMGWPATRDWFATRSDDQNVYWELIRAGCGVGFGQQRMIAVDPEVELLDIGVEIPPLPVWLAAPQAVRHTPRIAAVWDQLSEGLAPFIS
ncbi:HTH-type transcriptional activator CmpR [Thalassovita gelatinovora]|uniref:HTH-type transcriptional activator CmpR n=1 Tax=Thalassovita gelatinovora TaxID=53501 RepID=A0A0N7LUX6_THAGE|nr:LysR family transcriptional regulator [Thalassovita gelatinovora]QIZ81200.1 LysR family transcriptional regulator [Thalassovita gelatinovora]CUH64722.1 HTH-type transcriptional activator CmpR [Thalassovita gelatinovora]SEP93081.1 transcriptional regulator, LysR family [Thalassovita gelatinovora]